jgi:hypothetical protein
LETAAKSSPQKIMTTPFISVAASVLYFAWLWHGRSATDRSQRQSSNQPAKKSTHANENRALDLAPFSRVTPKPFNLKNVSTPVA